MEVLVCENSFDGMMTAIYDGWLKKYKNGEMHIHAGEVYEQNFLCTYTHVETDINKAIKVADSVRKKISCDAYNLIFRACTHYDEDRVDAVMDFMKLGFEKGARVTKDFGNPSVMRVVELARKAANEAHLYKGFVRFKEIEGNILYSNISPKCDVLPLIEHHFSGRFPNENFVIFDDVRGKALVHMPGKKSIYVFGREVEKAVAGMDVSDHYEKLWKVFFDTIGIESRENYNCQRGHIPLWYRENMVEFK